MNKSPVPFESSIGAIGWSTLYAIKFHIESNFLNIDNGILSSFVWIITFPAVYYIATNALAAFKKTPSSFTEKDKTTLSLILLFQLMVLIPVLCILSCDYIRIISYWMLSSFAIFLIIPRDTIEKMFPLIIIDKVNKLNRFMCYMLTPTKTILFLMFLLIGVSVWSFTVDRYYHTTMLYQLLWFISKPFVILKNIYLQL